LLNPAELKGASQVQKQKWILAFAIYFGVLGMLWLIFYLLGGRSHVRGSGLLIVILGISVSILVQFSIIIAYVLLVLAAVKYFTRKPDRYVLYLLVSATAIFASFVPGDPMATLAYGPWYPELADLGFSVVFVIISLIGCLMYLDRIKLLDKPFSLQEPWRTAVFIILVYSVASALFIAKEWGRGGSDVIDFNPIYPIILPFYMPGALVCSIIYNMHQAAFIDTCNSIFIPLAGFIVALLVGWFIGSVIKWKYPIPKDPHNRVLQNEMPHGLRWLKVVAIISVVYPVLLYLQSFDTHYLTIGTIQNVAFFVLAIIFLYSLYRPSRLYYNIITVLIGLCILLSLFNSIDTLRFYHNHPEFNDATYNFIYITLEALGMVVFLCLLVLFLWYIIQVRNFFISGKIEIDQKIQIADKSLKIGIIAYVFVVALEWILPQVLFF
jgi:hypothetical protein